MIKRKKKICKCCGNPKFIFSKGLCTTCWNREYKLRGKPKEWKGEKKKLKKISEKGKERKLAYKKARLEFLETHDHCEVALPGCLAPYPIYDKSTLQIHHKQGREGDRLTDQSKFLCVCGMCHRFIEDHSKWAYEQGYSLPRID